MVFKGVRFGFLFKLGLRGAGHFNSRVIITKLQPWKCLLFMAEKFMVEKFIVEKFIVEKIMVEKFMVEKYGIEKSRVEAWGRKIWV